MAASFLEKRKKATCVQTTIHLGSNKSFAKFGIDDETADFLRSFKLKSMKDILNSNVSKIREGKLYYVVVIIRAVHQYYDSKGATLQEVCEIPEEHEQTSDLKHCKRFLGKNRETLRMQCFHTVFKSLSSDFRGIMAGNLHLQDISLDRIISNLTIPELNRLVLDNMSEKHRTTIFERIQKKSEGIQLSQQEFLYIFLAPGADQ